MRNFDTPDPRFRYDLDARWWNALRREMTQIGNPQHTKLGVDAIDAFVEAIDHPPLTEQQLDALTTAIDCDSIVVARNAGYALNVLASIHERARIRLREVWGTLNSQGRWATLWSLEARTPETAALLREMVGVALTDRSDSIREWAASRAQAHRFTEYLPQIKNLAHTAEPTSARDFFAERSALLEHGYYFHASPIGDVAGSLSVAAHGEGPTSFSVSVEVVTRLGIEKLGTLASRAIQDPTLTSFRGFLEILETRQFGHLGESARTQ